MKKNTGSLLLLNLLFVLNSLAQDFPTTRERMSAPPSDRIWDKFFTGGNFGLQFGSQTVIDIAPIFGYHFTEYFSAGLGAKYIYYKINDANYNYSTNIYGGSLFARYLVMENLFTHVEYEVINLDVPDLYNRYHRKDITSVLVGGGYRQMIGERSSIDLMLLYNLNESRDSPYINPIIRVGFGLGL